MGPDNPTWNLCHQFCIKKEVSVNFFLGHYYISLLFKLTVVRYFGQQNYQIIHTLYRSESILTLLHKTTEEIFAFKICEIKEIEHELILVIIRG